MKKLLASILTGAMLIGSASSVIALDPSGAEIPLDVKNGAFLKIDEDANRLVLLDGPITVGKLKDGLTTDVTVKSRDGKTKSDSDPAATGDTVSAGDSTLSVLLYGDVNRDGRVDLADAVLTLRHIAGQRVDIDVSATDAEPDGKIDTADAVKLLRAVAGWEVSLGDLRMVAPNTAEVAPNEDADIDLYFETPLVKIGRSRTESTGKYTYKMFLARNETESAQMFLATHKDYTGLSVELGDFEYEFGGIDGVLTGEILWEYYYDITYRENVLWYTNGPTQTFGGYHVDALPPVADTFELSAGCSQGFMINVTSSKDAPAGLYRAPICIKNAAGEVIKTAYVYAYVWNFTLPDTPYSASAFGLESYIVKGSNYDPYDEYYEFLLQNNISAYGMPYYVTDPRAEAIMDDPRVTSFMISGGGNFEKSESYMKQAYDMVQANPEWKKKGYFYYLDEPFGGGVYQTKTQYEWLASVLGDENFRVVVPLAGDDIIDAFTGLDSIEFMKPWVNIWCPQSRAYKERNEFNYMGSFTPSRAFTEYGPTIPRLNEIRDDPKNDFWWYICIYPEFPWPNYFYCYSGVMNRVVLWQQFLFDIDGLLYWTVSNWANVTKRSTEWDGCLMYWGELFGFGAIPVSSYRLIQVRDSFDDFDYLRMVEEKYGRDTALEITHIVTTGALEVDEDPNAMIQARAALAALLEGTD